MADGYNSEKFKVDTTFMIDSLAKKIILFRLILRKILRSKYYDYFKCIPTTRGVYTRIRQYKRKINNQITYTSMRY